MLENTTLYEESLCRRALTFAFLKKFCFILLVETEQVTIATEGSVSRYQASQRKYGGRARCHAIPKCK